MCVAHKLVSCAYVDSPVLHVDCGYSVHMIHHFCTAGCYACLPCTVTNHSALPALHMQCHCLVLMSAKLSHCQHSFHNTVTNAAGLLYTVLLGYNPVTA